MTVCIAAICAGNSVIGASDRLITAGDVQFQPDSSKIKPISNSIVAMTAGDAYLQSELLTVIVPEIANLIEQNPTEWVSVRHVAERYCQEWSAVRKRRAEQQVLAPIGLTFESYLVSQTTLPPDVASQIAASLWQFSLPPVECIIAGLDASGPHIYVVRNGVYQCADSIGFVAIGSGGRHADSQLMLAQYAPHIPDTESLLLVHSAKRRAEVAPGVGSETDLFLVGPQLGSLVQLHDDLKAELDQQYMQIRAEEDQAMQRAKVGVASYLAALVARKQSTQSADDGGQRQG